MPTQTIKNLFTKASIKSYDHDPGATAATVVSPDGGTTKRTFDMQDYRSFALIAMASLLAGSGITKVEIIAAAAADMASPEVIADSGVVAADAVGDCVVLEINSDQVKEMAVSSGKALRYVAGRITCQNAGDEAVVTYIGSEPRVEKDALTANFIS